jgi:hypothetical protein
MLQLRTVSFKIMLTGILLLAFACGGHKTEKPVELDADFKKFVSLFPAKDLPLQTADGSNLAPHATPLPAADVKRYLGVDDATTVSAIGSVVTGRYAALIYREEAAPTESSAIVAFFDGNGVKKSSLTIYDVTDEVRAYFGSVNKLDWQGDTIRRTLSYHMGNGDDPDYTTEVLTAIQADGSLKHTPERIVPGVNAPGGEAKNQVYENEMAEYRSQSLRGYQLYAVYPREDAPVYLLINAEGKGRILSANAEKKAAEGTALVDDEFDAVVALEEKENPTGIHSFEKIKLVKKDGTPAEFMRVMVKRNLTFGEIYAYQHGEATGDVKISLKENATMSFTAKANTGAPDHHICELEGMMSYKANLAYYQGTPFDATCKVLFLFNDKTVDVFTVSGNADCGCGANVTLNGQYTKK